MRLGEWYYGDNNLILGTSCILNIDNTKYQCYIQEILKETNECIVFVTKLGQKRRVNYKDLSPENDAKPWPLPYRFSKNIVLCKSLDKSLEIIDKEKKQNRKTKDKKRTVSKSSGESVSYSPKINSNEIFDDVNHYEGCHLVIDFIYN